MKLVSKRRRARMQRRFMNGFLNVFAVTLTLLPVVTVAMWFNAVFIYNPRPVQALQQVQPAYPPFTLSPYKEPIVSITFDDGWQSTYTYAPKILQQYHMQGTFYVLSGVVDQQEYMSEKQIKSLYAAGHEIGSHSVDHKDLVTLSDADIQRELVDSKASLQKMGVLTDAPSIASPFSSYDARVLAKIRSVYAVHRNTEADIRVLGPEDMNIAPGIKNGDVVGFAVRSSTPDADIRAALAYAKAHNAWFVLVYHEIDESGSQYGVTPAAFERHMKLVHDSGIHVATINDVISVKARADK